MTARLCVVCKHFEFDGGSPDYSKYTPGSDTTMYCRLSLWPRESPALHYMTTDEFRQLLRTAEKCPKFEEAR